VRRSPQGGSAGSWGVGIFRNFLVRFSRGTRGTNTLEVVGNWGGTPQERGRPGDGETRSGGRPWPGSGGAGKTWNHVVVFPRPAAGPESELTGERYFRPWDSAGSLPENGGSACARSGALPGQRPKRGRAVGAANRVVGAFSGKSLGGLAPGGRNRGAGCGPHSTRLGGRRGEFGERRGSAPRSPGLGFEEAGGGRLRGARVAGTLVAAVGGARRGRCSRRSLGDSRRGGCFCPVKCSGGFQSAMTPGGKGYVHYVAAWGAKAVGLCSSRFGKPVGLLRAGPSNLGHSSCRRTGPPGPDRPT